MRRGDLVAAGRTSDVFEFGRGSVVKLLRPGVPAHWADVEAELTTIVERHGVPSTVVLDVVTIDDRRGVVFQRIDGPSMWQRMLDAPGSVDSLVDELVAVQRSIHSAGIPSGLPDLTARTAIKVDECQLVTETERSQARRLIDNMPRGAALLHGDLHPGNVLIGSDGPVVIDWFDAAIGHPIADLARSSLLMNPLFEADDHFHLSGAEPGVLGQIHRRYLEAWTTVVGSIDEPLSRWEPVLALARISEGAQADPATLLATWARRDRVGSAHPH